MDTAIQPIVVLLILSLITEKIANFVKLQFRTLSVKAETDEGERIRERRIQYISIIAGITVALVCKANLFLLFKNDFNLFWTSQPIEGEDIFSNIIGALISGFFLSLGSKFFHDLLDMILQIKNLKRKLNDKADMEFENIEAVNAYIRQDEAVRAEAVLAPFKQKLMAVENVVSVSSAFEKNAPILQVHVNKSFKDENLIPKKLFYPGINNLQKEMNVVIIHDGEAITHSAVSPANAISNANPYPGNAGSVGGKVYDHLTNEPRFMSCYHVVKARSHSWENFQPTGDETIQHVIDEYRDCGLIIEAIRDDEVDIAVMMATNGYEIAGSINGIGTPYFSRELTINDKIYKTRVRMQGMVSGYRTGYIIDINVPVRIRYMDGSRHQLNRIICIRADINEAFSKPGDSGSFIVDEYDYLVGVLVGGNENVSYVIPIETIFTKTNTKLIKT